MVASLSGLSVSLMSVLLNSRLTNMVASLSGLSVSLMSVLLNSRLTWLLVVSGVVRHTAALCGVGEEMRNENASPRLGC